MRSIFRLLGKDKFKDSLTGRTVDFEIFNLAVEEFLIFKHYPVPELGEQVSKRFTGRKIGEMKALFGEYVLFGDYPKIVLADSVGMKGKVYSADN